jgi:hypothetical protein
MSHEYQASPVLLPMKSVDWLPRGPAGQIFMPLAYDYVIQFIMIYFRLVSTSVAADNMRVNPAG